MQRVHICYVITKSNFGGAQKYVFELATALPKDHFAVTVALGGSGPLAQKLQDAGIHVIEIPHLERDVSITKEFRVFRFLYTLFRDKHFDVVHLNSSKIGGLGGLAARLAGVPRIIFTAHGFAFNEQRSWLSKQLIKLSYWVTMLLADQTIAVSRAIKEQVHGWPFLYRRLTVIPNGVRPIAFIATDEARTTMASQFPMLNLTKRWVCTFAELHPIKGLDVYIDAIATLNKSIQQQYQFVIMGEGEMRDILEAQIKAHGLTSTILLLGYVTNAPQYLKAFDAFVLPSRSEALALAILEAGFASLPVIASQVGGIPEVITNNVSGVLVPREDKKALSEALKSVLGDTVRATTMGTQLQQVVTASYTHETMVAHTIALYDRT